MVPNRCAVRSTEGAAKIPGKNNFSHSERRCVKLPFSSAGLELGVHKNINHLEQLREAADKCFPSLSTEKLDWIVSPFEFQADMAEELDLPARERNEFIHTAADSTMKVKSEKSDMSLSVFWHGIEGGVF